MMHKNCNNYTGTSSSLNNDLYYTINNDTNDILYVNGVGILPGSSNQVYINAADVLTLSSLANVSLTPAVVPTNYALAGPFTAGAGENQNGPVLTPNAYNVVASVQNNYDSVTLPPAIAGTIVFVMVPANQGTVLAIWANGSDSINGVVDDPVDYGSTPQTSFGGAAPAIFICLTNGAWYANGPLD